MIAKIIKGADFGGVINYMLSKEKGKAKVLASNNIGFIDQNLCADEFTLQASMRPNVQKPVCHTILSFSASDAERLTDDVMVKIANEYLEKMGYGDTQSLIVRHSDRNEKYRSMKICRELTKRYGLTLGEGKKAVNRHRLRGEDKLRYEIFDAIKNTLPKAKNWKDFVADLERQGIATRFKTKGYTNVVQGIIFEKDGCSFSGSKIDRSCSFSRLNAEIERNIQQAQQHLSKESMAHSIDESGFASDLSDALGEVFTMPMPSGSVDVDELRFQKKLRNRANRKRRI